MTAALSELTNHLGEITTAQLTTREALVMRKEVNMTAMMRITEVLRQLSNRATVVLMQCQR